MWVHFNRLVSNAEGARIIPNGSPQCGMGFQQALNLLARNSSLYGGNIGVVCHIKMRKMFSY
jgi:hypothetical protein